MKRIGLLFLILGIALHTRADDYPHLVLQQTDGTTRVLEADGLKIKFADGCLVAASGTQMLTLPLADLRAMYFSRDAATGIVPDAAAASGIRVADGRLYVTTASGTRIDVYTTDGHLAACHTAVGQGAEAVGGALSAGTYIVRAGRTTVKILLP